MYKDNAADTLIHLDLIKSINFGVHQHTRCTAAMSSYKVSAMKTLLLIIGYYLPAVVF